MQWYSSPLSDEGIANLRKDLTTLQRAEKERKNGPAEESATGQPREEVGQACRGRAAGKQTARQGGGRVTQTKQEQSETGSYKNSSKDQQTCVRDSTVSDKEDHTDLKTKLDSWEHTELPQWG